MEKIVAQLQEDVKRLTERLDAITQRLDLTEPRKRRLELAEGINTMGAELGREINTLKHRVTNLENRLNSLPAAG
jgi:uncharacterized coiled-coil protein SlyX